MAPNFRLAVRQRIFQRHSAELLLAVATRERVSSAGQSPEACHDVVLALATVDGFTYKHGMDKKSSVVRDTRAACEMIHDGIAYPDLMLLQSVDARRDP